MRLLVSVATAGDASAALEGGADIIDAKNPSAGSLGPVSLDVLREIRAAVGRVRPLTAALGDAEDEAALHHAAGQYAAAGVSLVKIGFDGIGSLARAAALLNAGVAGAARMGAGVIAVAYADASPINSLSRESILEVAADAGVRGVLLDTMNKAGPGLRELVTPDDLAAWTLRVHGHGLLAAIAGRLKACDLSLVRAAGADIAGVRGAVCEGGRSGRVSSEKVRALRAQLDSAVEPSDAARLSI